MIGKGFHVDGRVIKSVLHLEKVLKEHKTHMLRYVHPEEPNRIDVSQPNITTAEGLVHLAQSEQPYIVVKDYWVGYTEDEWKRLLALQKAASDAEYRVRMENASR